MTDLKSAKKAMSKSSEYYEKKLRAYFNKRKARKFLPIIHDPKGYGSNPKPDAFYYRILKKGKMEAIQYFLRWDKQDCTKSYPGIGYLFSHDFDYEPIIVFLEDGKLTKLVISAAGSLLQGGHQTEIFRQDKSITFGKVQYKTSKKLIYPYGVKNVNNNFKEDSLQKVRFKGNKPNLGLATCYHVYTTIGSYLRGPKLKVELLELTDEVLRKWYKEENFGHDVSNPWKYPHIKYHPSPKIKRLTEERTQTTIIKIENQQIRNGLAFLDKLRSESNPHQFWETLDPQIDHKIWPQSQHLMYVLYTILGMHEQAKRVKESNDFFVPPEDRPGKALDRFCILIEDKENFNHKRICDEADGGAADCIALMGLHSLLEENNGFLSLILRFLRSLSGKKPKSEKYFQRLESMYDSNLGFFSEGELFKISLFEILAKKIGKTDWQDILVKRLIETQSDNGGWKTHWIGPITPRPIGTVENLESTALSIIALHI
jgi:hypothetical protein